MGGEIYISTKAVGPDPLRQDGDPIVVKTDLDTKRVWIQSLLNPVKALRRRGKDFDEGCLEQTYYESVCLYRFEEVSAQVVLRTNIQRKLSSLAD